MSMHSLSPGSIKIEVILTAAWRENLYSISQHSPLSLRLGIIETIKYAQAPTQHQLLSSP